MLLALVLAAITGRTELLNTTLHVPASQWRAVKFGSGERPATVEVEYEVLSGRSGVRALLLTRTGVERYEKGQSHEVLAQTGFEPKGRFQYFATEPSKLGIVLDNGLEGRDAAEVRLKITLLHRQAFSVTPKVLGQTKRMSVVGISLGGFAIAVLLIGRKLLPVLRQ